MHTGEARVLHVITRLDRGGSPANTLLTVAGLGPPFRQTLVFGRTSELPPLATEVRRNAELIELPELVREPAPVDDVRALRSLYRLMRRGHFSLVHTHTSKAGILGRLAARLAGVPRIVHTPHGHYFEGPYVGHRMMQLFVRLERWAAGFTDRIVGLTDLEARQHVERGIGRSEQFVTIPSGVDLGPFDRPRSAGLAVKTSLGLPPSACVIGTVGRLQPVKGHACLLAAFAQLACRYPQAYLALVGDGELLPELSAHARDAGLGDRVRFLGWRDDIPTLLTAFDVFVLPSLNEGMGRALVEAMAAGRAVVASHVGGIPEVLDGGEAGLLVEPGSAAALADAIERVLSDPALAARLGEAARKQADRYSLATMLARLDALYRELLGLEPAAR